MWYTSSKCTDQSNVVSADNIYDTTFDWSIILGAEGIDVNSVEEEEDTVHRQQTGMSGGGYLCGTIFSFVGFVFLVVVGSLLKLQPMYILNAKSPNSGANSCFEAAMLYAVAMVFCYTMWRKEKLRAGEMDFLSDTFTLKRDRAYYGSEDSDEELPLAKNMSPTPRMV